LNELEAALLFSLLDVSENGVQIVVEASRVSVSYPTNLVDNGIVHGLDSKQAGKGKAGKGVRNLISLISLLIGS
jgi:hypothetical protein